MFKVVIGLQKYLFMQQKRENNV